MDHAVNVLLLIATFKLCLLSHKFIGSRTTFASCGFSYYRTCVSLPNADVRQKPCKSAFTQTPSFLLPLPVAHTPTPRLLTSTKPELCIIRLRQNDTVRKTRGLMHYTTIGRVLPGHVVPACVTNSATHMHALSGA
jgi:hypothetical protein